jgi:predicted Zn finger-like uncharacterized protein
MRLICPNCDAQYEVDDSAIPESGRDVQCSNCGHGWFQYPPGHEPFDLDLGDPADLPQGTAPVQPDDETEMPPPADPGDGPDAARPPLRRQPVDEGVLAILREEAEREQRAREAERAAKAGPVVETQAELALPASPPRLPATSAADPGAGDDGRGADAPRETRRDLLPDIEQINFSLKGNADRVRAAPADPGPVMAPPARGFRRGFLIAIAVFALLVALYAAAPRLSQAVPALSPPLDAYVGVADGARRWLSQVVAGWTG